jgi:hypothetical protein
VTVVKTVVKTVVTFKFEFKFETRLLHMSSPHIRLKEPECGLLSQEDLELLIGGCFPWASVPSNLKSFCARLGRHFGVDPVVPISFLLPVFASLAGRSCISDKEGFTVRYGAARW